MKIENKYPDYVRESIFEKSLNANQTFPLVKKYLRRDDAGQINETVSEAIYRMAKTVADVERKYGKTDNEIENYTKDFFDIIDKSLFSPAGRIWTNAGTEINGLFNCYVLPIEDDLESIFESVKKAAIIHKNGGGTGYNFSKIRPRGTYVKKSKGIASGPVSFIGQFNKETEIINSGNRRGANMGILDIDHPDILEFIYSKSEEEEFNNFNVSVGIYDYFMRKVIENGYYELKHNDQPFTAEQLRKIIINIEENKLGGSGIGKSPKPASLKLENLDKIVNAQTKIIDSYSGNIAGIVNDKGNVALSANYVMDIIANLAWKNGEPGVIFLDAINENNPLLPTQGKIKSTNPCGEQPLHPFDACNLGSIILPNIIEYSSSGKNKITSINYNKLDDIIMKAVRFMDNVNDANKGPIPKIEQTVLKNRRIGLGVMGWADMLIKMNLSYDSEESIILAEKIMNFISDRAKHYSVELAKEKGVFPNFKGSTYDTGKDQDRVRNVQRTTIAPTGTISMLYDVSSGIEPIYSIAYKKKIRGGDTLEYVLPQFKKKCLEEGLDIDVILQKISENNGSVQGLKEVPEHIQKIFKTAMDISYQNHILVQAAFQRGTDNAVSKTINMHENVTVNDIKNAYILAWEKRLKGITVYRNNSRNIQVLETAKEKPENGIINNIVGNINEPVNIPKIMPAFRITQRTTQGNLHTFVVYNPYSKTKQAIETFGILGNAGSNEAAEIEAINRLTSLYLRSGGNLEKIKEQLEYIGSGGQIIDRAGTITSLPMAFSVALDKFGIIMKQYSIEDIVTGKIDMNILNNEVSDYIRTNSRVRNNNNKNNTSTYVEQNTTESKQKSSKKYDANACPICGAALVPEEGCLKCKNCGTYSKC